MSDRLSDEQVTWWAIGYSRLWGPTMQPHPNGAVPDPDGEVTAMAREVQELRAEVERLTAENRMLGESGADNRARWRGERALADQLAEALRLQENSNGIPFGMALTCSEIKRHALAAWEAARHE